MADDVKPIPKENIPAPKGRRYKYLGQKYESVKDADGREVGVYDLYPDGRKLRPWLWTDDEIEKFIKENPDHLAVSRFEKV